MGAAPLTIKLRCASWSQLKAIYQRDLSRSALFLRSSAPPPLGTQIRIDLTLPSDSLIVLKGEIAAHVPSGGLDGRGPGVDIDLGEIPQSALWLIETALKSAGLGTAAAEPGAGASTARAPAVRESEIADGSDIADAESELIAALSQEFEALRRLNPFQVLDVPYETTDEAVRAAFGQLTRRYHPDRFARYQSQQARQLASEIFILIRDAYRKLGTEKARARTLQAMRSGGAATPTRGARATNRPRPRVTPTPATIAPRPAPSPKAGPPQKQAFTAKPASPPVALETRQSAGNASLLSDELFDGNGGGLGSQPVQVVTDRRAQSRNSYPDADRLVEAGELERALAIYADGARKHPGDRLARAGVELVEGLKALALRDRLEAAQRFEAVLELDPSNERAARELAEMRRIATNERKGLLARLLGKKE